MVTKEQFMRYYKVQMGGRYNMLDRRAIQLTGLTDAVYLDIIKNYDSYFKEYVAEG